MWKFIKLRQDVSPFAQVSAISSLTDLRPVIYDLEENRVEGVGFVEPNLPMKYQLNIETLQGIKRELKIHKIEKQFYYMILRNHVYFS